MNFYPCAPFPTADVYFQGQTYNASLAPTGQIRYGGDIFKTPMQWLTHLHGDGIMVKRRRSYQKVVALGPNEKRFEHKIVNIFLFI